MPTPQLPPQPRTRRTRGTARLRASSVPLNIPRKNKKRILPVIHEESDAAFNGDLERELNDVNTKNLKERSDMFNGTLPKGVLPRFV